MDPYAPCPCGSGKKFKWCCQAIDAPLRQAIEQEAAGQHDTAMRLLEELTKQHPDNPQAWAQKARLLYAHGQPEAAEEALQKAFDVNPSFPLGLFLRATFRFHEGELTGALLLARKAADAFDPEARDQLAEVYRMIFECEWRRQRPLAAHAALRLVTRLDPSDEEARKTFDHLFAPNSPRLPACARRDYTFLPPAPGAPPGVVGAAGPPPPAPGRRAAWESAARGPTGRLSDAARAFEAITKDAPDDGPAWFNLGLGRAWLGDNKGALDAFDHYLELENDQEKVAAAATLMEVMRSGQGLEEEGDYRQYGFVYQIRNSEPVQKLLDEWQRTHRLVVLQVPDQEHPAFLAMILELTASGMVTVGAPASDVARLGGYLALMGSLLQITSPLEEPYKRLREEVRSGLGAGLGELHERKAPLPFPEVVADALVFPLSSDPKSAGEEKALEAAQRYYEEKWPHQPRRALGGLTPLDAAGHVKLRKKLLGVVQFLQDCAALTLLSKCDFDRLRRKLGIKGAPAAPAGSVPADLSALGAAELAALPAATLSDDQLEQAFQAAQRLDAQEITARFAEVLLGRPPQPGKSDRYPYYTFLVTRALADGKPDEALDLVNAGEKADCEQNEGRRRNDFELKRGQVHVKRGEADQAHEVFQRLIERAPANFRYRGAAAEGMLALKQPGKALRIAEEGAQAARQAKDRGAEEYLSDLASAAKRQGG